MRYNKLKSSSETNPFTVESTDDDYYKLYSPVEEEMDLEQDNEDLDSDLLLGARNGQVSDHNLRKGLQRNKAHEGTGKKNSHVQTLSDKRMLNL